jgi:hypothetical protein
MKTAVEWLVDEMKCMGIIVPKESSEKLLELMFKAKEIEREHIEDAVMYGIDINAKYTNNVQETAEQYYNETFKSE